MKPENFMDMEKPELKPGETLCGNCWAVTADDSTWTLITFRHLEDVSLCPACAELEANNLATLKRFGL